MRKLLSIGIVLALLVTFVVPVVVAAQDDECCGYTPPDAVPLPDRITKTMAGSVMWTLLGTMDIMGKAVCATTGQMVANMGGWSDELGVIGVEITATALDGIAGLVEYVFSDALLNMPDLGTSIADLLKGIAEVLAGAAA
ncbi:MAG TPA: hypothetical protein VGA82_01405 [Dehalococcoidales bacterium]